MENKSRRRRNAKRKRNSLIKELNSIHIYTHRIEDECVKEWIEHIIEWYIRKSTFYKNIFYVLSAAILVINTSIPIINQSKIFNSTIIVSVISGIASLFSGVITLFTMRDTWFRYRKHVELIKKECMMYNRKIDCYKNDDREDELIKKVEAILDNEKKAWVKNKMGGKEFNTGK